MVKRLFLVFLLLCLVGCKNKEAIDADVFKKKAEEKGYTIQDVTDKNDIEVTSIALLALHSNYEMEFYKLNSKESSISTYNMIKTKIELSKKKGSKEKSANGRNYQKYILETDKNYTVVSRVDTTILYASTPLEYKKIVEKDIESFGY